MLLKVSQLAADKHPGIEPEAVLQLIVQPEPPTTAPAVPDVERGELMVTDDVATLDKALVPFP